MVQETPYGYDPASRTAVQANVSPMKRISWAAVFAGVILALVIQLLLNMLGTGIGMSTVDPMKGETPSAATFGISAGIWWTVSSLIALFIGGWIAGHLAGIPRKTDGVIHGLLTWGLSTLLLFYLLASAVGSAVGGAFGLAGNVLSAAGQGVAAVAPKVADVASGKLNELDISWSDIKQEAQTLLRQTGKPELQPGALKQQAKGAAGQSKQAAQGAAENPSASDEEFDSLLDRLIRQGKNVASEADREAVVNVVVARTGMSREEAMRTVQNWEKTYQQAQAKYEEVKKQAEQKARKVADQTAQAVSRASLWGFFALVLGAIASAYGGLLGRPLEMLPR